MGELNAYWGCCIFTILASSGSRFESDPEFNSILFWIEEEFRDLISELEEEIFLVWNSTPAALLILLVSQDGSEIAEFIIELMVLGPK